MVGMGNPDEIMRKIFLGGILKSTTEDTLKSKFGQYGTITDCVIIRDRDSKISKGFGFITFDDECPVEHLLEWDDSTDELKTPIEVDGKKIDVKRAIPRENNEEGAHAEVTKLFIGGLAPSVTAEDIQEELNKRHNPETTKCGSIKSVTINMDKETGKSKGFGFITVSSRHLADRLAIREETIELKGKKASLKKAKPEGGGGGGRGGRGGRGGGDRGGRGGQRGGRGGYQQGGGGGGYQQQGGYGGGYGQQSAAPAYGAGGYGGQSGGYGQSSYGAAPSYAGGYSEQASTAYPGQSYSRGGAGGRGGYQQQQRY